MVGGPNLVGCQRCKHRIRQATYYYNIMSMDAAPLTKLQRAKRRASNSRAAKRARHAAKKQALGKSPVRKNWGAPRVSPQTDRTVRRRTFCGTPQADALEEVEDAPAESPGAPAAPGSPTAAAPPPGSRRRLRTRSTKKAAPNLRTPLFLVGHAARHCRVLCTGGLIWSTCDHACEC